MENLNEIQQKILKNTKIPKNAINSWIYNNQSIVFDFLITDFFISISYNTNYNKLTFIFRSKGISENTSRKIYIQYFNFIKNNYPKFDILVTENNFSFTYKDNYPKILEEILKKTYLYFQQVQSVENIIDINSLLLEDINEKLNTKKYIGIKSDQFILAQARKINKNEIIYKLSNYGFIAVDFLLNITVFRKIEKEKYNELLPYFPDTFECLNNIIFNLEKPKLNSNKGNNLVIIFSYTNKCNEKPLERYYTHTYPFISTSLLPNTYIARIVDLDGAFGSHGLNSKFNKNIESNIQNFIQSLSNMYGIKKDNIVILGASSGGTGALYHALLGDYKTYSIDPYLGSEEYYKNEDPLYLQSLDKKIKDIFNDIKKIGTCDAVICTSRNSEFYNDIIELKRKITNIKIIEYNDPEIVNHPQVAGKTNYLTGMFINNLLLNYRIEDTIIEF